MIKAQNISKQFGSKLAVDDVSFEVKAGEVLGFLGPNGAGKSTTMRMLTGYLPVSGGTVVINGHDMENDPIAAKASIGYLPENAPSYPDSNVEAFLKFIAEVKGLSGKARNDAVEDAIRTCQLDKVRHQTIDTLSKGYKHRTCFAQAIIGNPPILVLDEPTDGLDPNQKNEMRHLIREMGKTKAIIVSTHILEEVEAICTRVIIIDKGHVVFNGTPAELKAQSPDAGTVVVRIEKAAFADVEAALSALPQASGVAKRSGNDDALAVAVSPRKGTTGLAKAVKGVLDQKGWSYDELHTEPGRLDYVFQNITSAETAAPAKENK